MITVFHRIVGAGQDLYRSSSPTPNQGWDVTKKKKELEKHRIVCGIIQQSRKASSSPGSQRQKSTRMLIRLFSSLTQDK